MTLEANSSGNCKSSVSIPRERASRSIYFKPVPRGSLEREGANVPIGTEDRIAAMNSHSSHEYVQGILFISRAGLKSSSWRLLACSHLVIFIVGFFFCERVFTNIGIARASSQSRRFTETGICEAKLRGASKKMIYCTLILWSSR